MKIGFNRSLEEIMNDWLNNKRTEYLKHRLGVEKLYEEKARLHRNRRLKEDGQVG